jgi:uncharacterized protein (UPF0261 family)
LALYAELMPSAPFIAVSSCSLVRPCSDAVVRALAERGFAARVYDTDGRGGRELEADVLAGRVTAVFDLSLMELAAELVGADGGAGPDRLTAAALRGVPQVIVPGALDAFLASRERQRPEDRRTSEYAGVLYYRTTPEENDRLGREIAHKASAARGPTTIVLPLGGLSALDAPGRPFDWPEARLALFQSLRNWLAPQVKMLEVDVHINDSRLAQAVVASSSA